MVVNRNDRLRTRDAFGAMPARPPGVKACSWGRCLGGILLALPVMVFADGVAVSEGSPPGVLAASAASASSLARHKKRTLADVGPYDARDRWETYVALSELFDRLWRQPVERTTLNKARSLALEGADFVIEDRDDDGRGEFYAYVPRDDAGETQDFGAYFDLSDDGRPDWIVFFGGSAMTGKAKLFWWHQHGIDTNGDGRFDVRVVGMIDTDGDGSPEEGATTWVYDTDFDGLIDRAEHIVDGRVTAIEPQNGALPLGWVMRADPSDQPRVGDPTSGLFDLIARDIEARSGN